MSQNKQNRTDDAEPSESLIESPAAATILRPQVDVDEPKAKSDESNMSTFWRVFGGTILSIVALVALTLYNNLTTNISELRAEINKINEARGELVKKDEFNTRTSTYGERVQLLQSQNNEQNATLRTNRIELDGFKERLTRHDSELDLLRKDTQSVLEGLKKDVAAIDAIKERLAAATMEGRTTRDEYQKLRQDVDRNQAADQERKLRRDEQYKDVDALLKSMSQTIQDLQLKVARIEGQQQSKPTPPAKSPAPRPAKPATEPVDPPPGE